MLVLALLGYASMGLAEELGPFDIVPIDEGSGYTASPEREGSRIDSGSASYVGSGLLTRSQLEVFLSGAGDLRDLADWPLERISDDPRNELGESRIPLSDGLEREDLAWLVDAGVLTSKQLDDILSGDLRLDGPFEGVRIVSREGASPGLMKWEVQLPVQPFSAYEVFWTSDLRSGQWTSMGVDWKDLGDLYAKTKELPVGESVFFKVGQHPAFGIDRLPPAVFDLMQAKVDGPLVFDWESPNHARFSFTQTEDGVEVSTTGTLDYERQTASGAVLEFVFGVFSFRDLSSGETRQISLQELANTAGQALPLDIVFEIDFTRLSGGSVEAYSNMTDGSRLVLDVGSF